MSSIPSVDQIIIQEIKEDAKQVQKWAVIFFISSLLLQFLHLLDPPIWGFRSMLIVAGLILFGASILFYLGSISIPQNRSQIIARLQKIMLDKNPKRRLWAAQRLIGYIKEANFTRNEILEVTLYHVNIIKEPPYSDPYRKYIATDHIIVLREIAVSVPMDKHTRKEFVKIVKALKKLKDITDEGAELLTDAIAYDPNKSPAQAIADLHDENIK